MEKTVEHFEIVIFFFFHKTNDKHRYPKKANVFSHHGHI